MLPHFCVLCACRLLQTACRCPALKLHRAWGLTTRPQPMQRALARGNKGVASPLCGSPRPAQGSAAPLHSILFHRLEVFGLEVIAVRFRALPGPRGPLCRAHWRWADLDVATGAAATVAAAAITTGSWLRDRDIRRLRLAAPLVHLDVEVISLPTTMSSLPPLVNCENWTKTSSEPSAFSMKPKPLPSMNFFKIPEHDIPDGPADAEGRTGRRVGEATLEP